MARTVSRAIFRAGIFDVGARARTALAEHGFGVLAGIDVRAPMRTTLNAGLTAVAGGIRDLSATVIEAV